MNISTENSTEKSFRTVPEQKPVSVYSVKFTKVINNFADEKFVPKQKSAVPKIAAHELLSKKVFSGRKTAAIAAILAIGVLHFAFQMSIIRIEVSENRPVTEVPAVEIEPFRAAIAEPEPAEIQIKKIAAELPPKPVRAVRDRQTERAAAPSKWHLKKREAVETRAARLRRAEKLLTGA